MEATNHPTTELLSDEALERIEKRLELRSDHTIPRSQLPVTPEEEVAALCATVRALRDQLAQVRFDLKQAEGWIADVEEREAAVCPKDVGFDEYIRTLTRERDDYRDQLVEAKAETVEKLAQVEKERDRLKEDLRILTKGRFIQS